jgi:GNAT superfamily N-acetyltransferase
MHKRFIAMHTTMNKVTGVLLFIVPLTLSIVPLIYTGIPICSVATFAAVQEGQYVQLVTFQVSEPFRGMGVGRKLFEKAAGAAKGHGAKKLYISAHSSKESQAAYKALGCVHAEEIIPWIADEEPFDVQLEFVL